MSRRLWTILIAVLAVGALILVPDAVSARNKPPKHKHNGPAAAGPNSVANPNLTVIIPGFGTIDLPSILPGLVITIPTFTPPPPGPGGGGGAGGLPGGGAGGPGAGPSAGCPGGAGGGGGSPGGGAGGCGG